MAEIENTPENSSKEQKKAYPILPLRNTVLFPGVVIPITVSRDKSIQLINNAYNIDLVIPIDFFPQLTEEK